MEYQSRVLHFKRTSDSTFLSFEDRIRSDARFKDKDIDLLLQLVGPGGLIRRHDDLSPVGNLFSMFRPTTKPGVNFVASDARDLTIQLAQFFLELFGSPYVLNLVNRMNEPVQFVWAYELYSGLIPVIQSPYTEPGATATLATTDPFTQCIQVKQYAISVWDQNDQEIGRIPNLIVEQINDVELQKGTWRPCEDTIEIG